MKNLKLSENTGIQLPAKNLLMIVAGAVVATISFFELENRIGSLETSRELFEAEPAITNWPRTVYAAWTPSISSRKYPRRDGTNEKQQCQY